MRGAMNRDMASDAMLETILQEIRDLQDQLENAIEHIKILNHKVTDLVSRVEELEDKEETPGPN